GTRRELAVLLGPQCLDQSFGRQPVQRAVQGAGLDFGPHLGPVNASVTSQLVAIHRAALGQRAKDEQASRIHCASKTRLLKFDPTVSGRGGYFPTRERPVPCLP